MWRGGAHLDEVVLCFVIPWGICPSSRRRLGFIFLYFPFLGPLDMHHSHWRLVELMEWDISFTDALHCVFSPGMGQDLCALVCLLLSLLYFMYGSFIDAFPLVC